MTRGEALDVAVRDAYGMRRVTGSDALGNGYRCSRTGRGLETMIRYTAGAAVGREIHHEPQGIDWRPQAS
jgi:hypothetical protein